MKVYVLDMCGYDVRGGIAEVYASLEGAMAAVPHVKWLPPRDGEDEREWTEDVGSSLADMWVISERELRP